MVKATCIPAIPGNVSKYFTVYSDYFKGKFFLCLTEYHAMETDPLLN